MMIRSTYLASLAITLLCAASAHAVIATFDDKDDYNAYAAGRPSFEIATLEESSLESGDDPMGFAGPLSPTSTNAPYESGIPQPLSIQAVNIIDISIGSTSPVGGSSLAAYPAGTYGGATYGSHVVLANSGSSAIELLFNASDNVSAVGFNPIASVENATADIYIFDTFGTQIGNYDSDVDFTYDHYFGIGIDSGPFIGRIIIDRTSTSGGSIGVDNISISAIPEPGSFVLMGLVALAIGGRRTLGTVSSVIKTRFGLWFLAPR